MRIHVVSNLRDGKGLARDARILDALLGGWGHQVRCWPLDRTKALPRADLVIFLERIVPHFLDAAPRRWLIPNPEQWRPEDDALLHRMTRVLCKTEDALRLFGPRHGDVVFTGFASEDRHDAGVPRARRFLHVAGSSPYKGTQAVLAAWARFGWAYPLDVVWSAPERSGLPSVRFHRGLPDAELRRLQNACRFHLCPSAYEGFGHTIHEGFSVGACVVVTDAPPMRGWAGSAALVPVAARERRGLAELALVSVEGLREVVEACIALDEEALDAVGTRARSAFVAERAGFERRMMALVATTSVA